ncbi:hypothetical protein SAMN04489731_10449 [Amycolatopsis regifaucium]|nr:hypothetical protein SAMN04489731_10449 [Amycolatopsis regifaucium]
MTIRLAIATHEPAKAQAAAEPPPGTATLDPAGPAVGIRPMASGQVRLRLAISSESRRTWAGSASRARGYHPGC